MKKWFLIVSSIILFAGYSFSQEYRFGAEYTIPAKGKVEYRAIGELRDKSDKNEQTVITKAQIKYQPFRVVSVGGSARCAIGNERFGLGFEKPEYRLAAQAKVNANSWIDDLSFAYRIKYDHDFNDKTPGVLRNKFIVYYKVNSRAKTHCSYETHCSPYRRQTLAHRYSVGSKWSWQGRSIGLELAKEVLVRRETAKSNTILSLQVGL